MKTGDVVFCEQQIGRVSVNKWFTLVRVLDSQVMAGKNIYLVEDLDYAWIGIGIETKIERFGLTSSQVICSIVKMTENDEAREKAVLSLGFAKYKPWLVNQSKNKDIGTLPLQPHEPVLVI